MNQLRENSDDDTVSMTFGIYKIAIYTFFLVSMTEFNGKIKSETKTVLIQNSQ